MTLVLIRQDIARALTSVFALFATCGCGAAQGTGAVDSPSGSGPVITACRTLSVNEGQTARFTAATATLAAGRSATWSVSGPDSAIFSVDPSTGALAFKSAPNYAAPADASARNAYAVTLSVSDGSSTSSVPLTVHVLPWNQGGAAALPAPPVRTDRARPNGGAAANLRVLPWAGFTAAVSYTFDDSSPSQLEHWPDLKVQRVRSTFYINPSANRIAGYDDIWKDAIGQGFEIGNHTTHHCFANQLGGAGPKKCSNDLGTPGAEIDDTTAYIRTRLGQRDAWTFAYPFGDLGYQPAARERFFMSRGVSPGTVAPDDAMDPSNLPIVAHAGDSATAGGDPVTLFNADIDAVRSQGHWMVFMFHTLLPTASDSYAGENIAVVTGSMAHAKALGDVWLDSVVNVGAYWQGQLLLKAATPVTSGNRTTWTWTLPAHFPPGRKLRVLVDGGTLWQNGQPVAWDGHGYYEIDLDAKSLNWAP